MIRRNNSANTLAPDPLPFVPKMLKEIPNWVSWKLVDGDKPPLIAGTDKHASSTDPSTWTDYQTAVTKTTINGVEGVGFVLGGLTLEKKILGVDIDGCYDPNTDTLTPWAEKIVDLLGCYTERTPSGLGLRIWVVGEWPFKEHKFNLGKEAGHGDKVGIEIYDVGRYFTVTGDAWYEEAANALIEPRDLSSLHNLCLEIQTQYPRVSKSKIDLTSASAKGVEIKQEGSVITDKYELLMRGTVTGDKPLIIADGMGNSVTYDDRSAADLALCTFSALKHGDNPDAIWKDYENSSLFRPKWEKREDDFRRLTIANGIATAAKMNGAQTPVSNEARPDWANETPQDFESENRTEPSSDEDGRLKIYDMTKEELAIQDEAEYPVFKLKRVAGPDFDPAHLYGVVGRIAKRMCEHSEAHLASVYLNLIVSFGSIIGRGPYFNVDNTTLYTNDYLAIAGLTAEGRKGLAADVAGALLANIDTQWFSNRNCGGFSSSQAVLSELRDDSTFQKFDSKLGGYKTVIQPGVRDKRLCIRESELSNLFKLMADPKSRAAEVFRNMWDSKPLSNRVAGKTEIGEHNTLVCKEPHGSIVGTTTPSLARTTMPLDKETSGDGNRFLWCYTKRTQLCPAGGPRIDWATETINYDGTEVGLILHLVETISRARQGRLVPICKSTRRHWNYLYQKLEAQAKTGLLGGMTTRGAAHVRKIAMILALLDREDEVNLDHLEAAEYIWDYSLRSARYIFMSMSLEGSKIVRAAEAAGPVGITATDVHRLFGNNRGAEWVRTELADLVSGDFLTRTLEQRPYKDDRTQEVNVFRFKKWE
jgi:hypothetical protein